jgi:hypothetical protein
MSDLSADMEKSPNTGDRPSQDNTISDGTLESDTNEKVNEDADDVAQEDPTKEIQADEEWEYVTGFKLITILGTVTLACFIMMLDTSIVVTVSCLSS